ncbi:kynureninase [Sinimarinibacterium flocculans]|uniref:Kynureninase n=1 Tax=Sinimarinibacterium flocculans TaxID=985250 RepID=A0A318EBL1_9GAMM|nr:kynureninase [Sinimarinibacterium flocculans]PXV66647.1 kynureninase [Sinimarinibacterium flocculans]
MLQPSATDLPTSREACRALDAADPLAAARAAFVLPPDVIYLDGNSLGPMPAATRARLQQALDDEWSRQLVGAWNGAGWIDLAPRVAAGIAGLIGAHADEVAVADSTSVNLFKLLGIALRLRPSRRTILTETGNFPTDRYVAEGLAGWTGEHRLRSVDRERLAADPASAIDDDTAVLTLSHVDYRSGAMHDLARITAAAHARGALVLWDLAHSTGAVPVDLEAAQADFAVGCGYKYLNGGPGAPAFAYLARSWHAQARSPLTGWFGHREPFAFAPDYAPATAAGQLQCGTPPILSLLSLDVGVQLLAGLDGAALRAKSLALTDLFIARCLPWLGEHGLELVTPQAHAQRGSQVSLRHARAWPICQALIESGVVGDFRAPDILRLGFAPAYLRHVDAWDAAERLHAIMRAGIWQDARFDRQRRVT